MQDSRPNTVSLSHRRRFRSVFAFVLVKRPGWPFPARLRTASLRSSGIGGNNSSPRCSSHGVRFEKFDDFFDELFAYFAEPSAWSLYPEVVDTLAALKQRGLHSSVISNFDSRLVPILNGLGVGPFFERIFVSSRVGYAKPDPQIFRAALKHHGVKPEQSLHVGDSEVNDLHGANSAGLRGILVDRREPANASGGGERVRSLQSILDLVP